MAAAPTKPSGVRTKTGHDILIFCRILENISTQMPHSKQQRRSVRGTILRSNDSATPPAYVKPFVKRQKSDAADTEAICEAAQRPSMRFVPIKDEEQQANGVVFRARDLLVHHDCASEICIEKAQSHRRA